MSGNFYLNGRRIDSLSQKRLAYLTKFSYAITQPIR